MKRPSSKSTACWYVVCGLGLLGVGAIFVTLFPDRKSADLLLAACLVSAIGLFGDGVLVLARLKGYEWTYENDETDEADSSGDWLRIMIAGCVSPLAFPLILLLPDLTEKTKEDREAFKSRLVAIVVTVAVFGILIAVVPTIISFMSDW